MGFSSSLEVFDGLRRWNDLKSSEADLDAMQAYFVGIGRASAAFASHLHRRPGVLVQLNGDLPDERAARYEAALATVR